MSDHAIEHDYHLVEPSPWPFLSGVAALVWGLGMVVFFAGLHPRSVEHPHGSMEFLWICSVPIKFQTVVGFYSF